MSTICHQMKNFFKLIANKIVHYFLNVKIFLFLSPSLFFSFFLSLPLLLFPAHCISLLPSLAPSLCISNRLSDPDYHALGVNQSADVIINAATETKGILGFLNAARKTPLNTTQPVLAANLAPALIPVTVEGI